MIQVPLQSAKELIKAYTIKNKDIDRQEKMRGRSLPWMRRVKLYVEDAMYAYFPVGLFHEHLNKTRPLTEKLVFNKTYREEQQWVIDNVGKTGLIVMKTGKGKSNAAVGIIEKFQEKTLIACHSKVGLLQMVETFKEFASYDVGVYYGDKKAPKEITITTHDSLTEKYKELKKEGFGIVIIDECDRNLTAKMLQALIFIDPTKLYGMTGTPNRIDMDEEDLQMVFGPMIRMPDQKNNGYMMIPKIVRLLSTQNKYFSFEHWADLRQQMINDDERTNAQCKKILELRTEGKFKYGLLLLLYRETEANMYHKILNKYMPTYLIHGLTKKKDDAIAAAQFKETGGLIIGTTGKLGRGLDIPHLDTLFLFYPNKFKSDTIQSVGRILRLDEGKVQPIVYDWCDLPILKGQANERMATYKREYGDALVIEEVNIL